MTIETWVTVDPSTFNADNGRLFALGSTAGANEIGVTANSGNNALTRFFGPPTVSFVRGGQLGSGIEIQLVAEYHPSGGTIDLLLNGIWQNSVTNLGFSLASITNTISMLGVGLDTNGFTAALFNEFRIYNGALDLLGIRTSLAAGPDTLVTNPGAPVSLTVKVDPIMVLGSRQIPHVQASFAAVTNVDLTQADAVSLSSSDSTVVSVTADGRLQAAGLGSATITASLGGKTATASVSVYPKQTMLAHRYSFTSDASDSVVFDGDTANKNSYVDLPSGLISSFDSVTLEAWVSLGTVGTWARIIDFGSQSSTAGGLTYVFLCPHTGTPNTRAVLSDGTEAGVELASTLDGFSGQVAVVYDPPSNIESLYTNGVLAASAGLGGKLLSGVNDIHCWLGKSLYAGDSGLSGSIDELRIYAGAFTAAQVTADFNAGPNTVVLAPPVAAPANPKLSATLSGSNIVITWAPAGGTLQSSTSVGAGATWLPVGTANPATIPLSGSVNKFFRVGP